MTMTPLQDDYACYICYNATMLISLTRLGHALQASSCNRKFIWKISEVIQLAMEIRRERIDMFSSPLFSTTPFEYEKYTALHLPLNPCTSSGRA